MRLDIKLCWSDFILGVENKPRARDQVGQIADYVSDLDKESQGRFLCVYLSSDGSPPDESSICTPHRESLAQKDQLKWFSYPKVMCRWLDECIRECQADKVRWFLREFRDYLLRVFPQINLKERNMTWADGLILSYALQCDEHVEVAVAVGKRFHFIKQNVIGKFAEVLQCELERRLARRRSVLERTEDRTTCEA